MRGLIESLELHRQDWEDLAELDSFWSILVDKGRKHGTWDSEAFFRTGERVVQQCLQVLDDVGLPRERGLALDFGCGLGRLSAPLAQHFERCVGVDISARMVEQARRYHRRDRGVSFQVLDRLDLSPLGEQRFDFILSLLVLQHQPSPEHVAIWLRELIRVLKPEGLLMFQLPHRLGLRTRWQLRRRAYRLLRSLRVDKRVLYSSGLYPIRMLAVPEPEVRKILTEAGGRLCRILNDQSAGPRNGSLLYLVTR